MRNLARLFAWRPGRPTPGHQELVGLQFIRGIAATLVVLDHVSSMSAFDEFYGRHLFNSFPEAGAVGVRLFFCLSGFIILYVSLGSDFRPKVRAGEFVKRRFARIIPFLWAVVLIFMITIGRHGAFDVMPYLRAMVLFPFGVLAPNVAWTLRHEFLFYLLFAATFLKFPRLRWTIALWVLSPFALHAFVPHASPLAALLFNDANILFGFGMVAAMLFIKYEDRLKLPAVAGLAVPVLAVCLHLLVWYERDPWTSVSSTLEIGALSFLCVLVGAGVQKSQTILGDLGKLLGDASYSIYLTHGLFVGFMLRILSQHAPRLSDGAILAATASAGIVGGTVLHFVLERPIVSLTKCLMHSGSRASNRARTAALVAGSAAPNATDAE